MQFVGLTQAIFDAYLPDKWSSNVYNLERMKAKDTLITLCTQAQEALDGATDGLVRAASDEIPNIANQKKVDAQWVYWFRNPVARESLASFLKELKLDESTIFHIAPYDKHAVLAVLVRQEGLWIGLRLASGSRVDRRNLAAKLGKSWERDQLFDLLKELPEGAEIGAEGTTRPTADLSADTWRQWAEDLSGQNTWMVGHAVPVEDAVGLGADLPDLVGRWLGTLLPVYRFAAWSVDNDHIEATKQIKEEKEQARRQATAYKSGDKVRVIGGLFSGKLGVVESVDTKAQVKVRVGKMSVVIAGQDLAPA